MIRDKRAVVAINPYAAPTVSNAAFDSAYAGIGVWNDDGLLVIHSDAELPPYCLRSGEPTNGRVFIAARWLYRSFEIRPWARVLAVPLAKPWRVKSARWLLIGWPLLGLTCAFAIPMLVGRLNGRGWPLIWTLVGEVFVIMMIIPLLRWLRDDLHPLVCVRSAGHYHWLKGAGSRFLERLPDWPADY